MSEGGRSFVDETGRPRFFAVDTAWALPFRATLAETEEYARDRAAKGYTGTLLMAIQPDMRAGGPDDREAHGGFARGVEGVAEGRLGTPIEAYFRHLDEQIAILRGHGIVPFVTPLFFGFGWRGLDVIGPVVDPGEAARFARFLAERYDDGPVVWLAGADGTGTEPAVAAIGRAIREVTTAPIGIHYNPWQLPVAHEGEPWCDFHLVQTGHGGEHRPEVLAPYTDRALANGEPTYEGMDGGAAGRGDWQRHEAWSNFCAGGTLSCFYGAASLWQWKRAGEDDLWGPWCAAADDWRGAMAFPGATFPGVVARIVDGLGAAEWSPSIDGARGRRCAVAADGSVVAYAEGPGTVHLAPETDGGAVRVHDSATGELLAETIVVDPDPHMGFPVRVDRAAVITVTPRDRRG